MSLSKAASILMYLTGLGAGDGCGDGAGAGTGGALAQETGTSRHTTSNSPNITVSFFFIVASYMLSLSAGLVSSGCRFRFNPHLTAWIWIGKVAISSLSLKFLPVEISTS